MSETRPAGPAPSAASTRALRVLGLTAVCLGVAALAAATFVLSYPGIHAFALQAGINHRLARGYPLLIDAMLLIAGAAVLWLRAGGLPSKLFAWFTLLLVLAAAAGADAMHAANRRLPARPAAITAAVLPWVLVFIGFALLLAMLRYARLRRLTVVSPVGSAPAQPERLAVTDLETIHPVADRERDHLAVDAELPPDDPNRDESASDQVSLAGAAADAEDAEPDPDLPVFHRMWSAPTPPSGT